MRGSSGEEGTLSESGPAGVVGSPHWLATEAGAQVLKEGGSAADAAIATNAVLCVVYPHMCGIGGDLFGLYFDAETRTVSGLNGSGPAPQNASSEGLARLGEMPRRGGLPVTVPGAVSAWGALHARFGALPLAALLARSIEVAQSGYVVTERLAKWIGEYESILSQSAEATKMWLPGGRPPQPGETLRSPDLATSLERIALEGPRILYEGELASRLVEGVKAAGGLLEVADLAAYDAFWCRPASMRFRDWHVHTTPPNSQGIALLLMLALFEETGGLALAPGSGEWIRCLVEAKQRAFVVRDMVGPDPRFVRAKDEFQLDDAALRGFLSDVGAVSSSGINARLAGDTVALVTRDRAGNSCVLIESVYFPFGSGVVPEGTGILLQNRGAYFSLKPGDPNVIEGGKHVLHTLMPAMATSATGDLRLALGTMGGDGQPQTLAQIITRVKCAGQSVADAIDAPRFLDGRFVIGENDDDLNLESRVDEAAVRFLAESGYSTVVREPYDERMGHACAISIAEDHRPQIASDPRSDALAPTAEEDAS